MKSPLWPALYPLRADLVRAGISLGCGTSLKVPLTVGIHSGPPRDSNKKQKSWVVLNDNLEPRDFREEFSGKKKVKKEKEERGKRTENTSNHAPIKISSREKDKRLGQLYQY